MIFGNSQQQFTVTDRWCQNSISPIQEILCKMATTKTTITTWAMNLSVRPTTASSQSGMTWTRTITCSSQSTTSTSMTTFTQTLAWCTSCTELAHSAQSSHTSLAQDLSLITFIHGHIHGRTSLTRLSLSTSTCSFPSFSVYFFHFRAVPWARQPDRNGKPVLLRQQGEWGRPRRLHPPHSLDTACYLAGVADDTRHATEGESNQAAGATTPEAEMIFISQERNPLQIRIQKDIERIRVGSNTVLSSRRLCEGQEFISTWVTSNSSNWRSHRFSTHHAFATYSKEHVFAIAVIYDSSTWSRSTESRKPSRLRRHHYVHPNLYKMVQMWTESIAIVSPRSSWRITRRSPRIHVHLGQMAILCSIQAILGCSIILSDAWARYFDHIGTIQYLPYRCSNENGVCMYFLRSDDENRQTPLLSQRLRFREAKKHKIHFRKGEKSTISSFSSLKVNGNAHITRLVTHCKSTLCGWAKVGQNIWQENIISRDPHPVGPQVHLGALVFMDFGMANMASTQLAGWETVIAMVSGITWNLCFTELGRATRWLALIRLKTTSSKLSPANRKSDRMSSLVLF